MCRLAVQRLSLMIFFLIYRVHAGKLGQVTDFTRVDGTAKHCVDQYMVVLLLTVRWATLLCWTGYMPGFATHF